MASASKVLKPDIPQSNRNHQEWYGSKVEGTDAHNLCIWEDESQVGTIVCSADVQKQFLERYFQIVDGVFYLRRLIGSSSLRAPPRTEGGLQPAQIHHLTLKY